MERIEVARSRVVPLAFIFSGVVVLAAMLLLFDPLPPQGTAGFSSFVVVLAGTRLVPVLVCLALIQLGVTMLRDSRPVIAVDVAGISSRYIRPAVLPWREIARASTRIVAGAGDGFDTEVLCIELRDSSRLQEVLDHPAGPLGFLMRMARGSGRTIDITVSEGSGGAEASQLARVINANAGRRQPPSSLADVARMPGRR